MFLEAFAMNYSLSSLVLCLPINSSRYSSSCVASSYCSSMVNATIGTVPDGLYTLRSFEVRPCEPGYFCTGGQRLTCPPGYKCPRSRMTGPQHCQVNSHYNTTCYNLPISGAPGLVDELPCPAGDVCPVPFMDSLASPPGYMIDNRPGALRDRFIPCQGGNWCALGAHTYDPLTGNSTDQACPLAHYCPTPAITEPILCNFSSAGGFHYCPAGTQNQSLCPAGHYCTTPISTTTCANHQ